MTWFKVDDGLGTHPKARAAGAAAMGVWVLCGSWSSQQLTDGYVPAWFVYGIEGGRKGAERLVEAGLWHPVDGGWVFHEWDQANPTRNEVVTRRATDRARVARWRASRAESNGARTSAPTRPDPNT